MLILHAALSEAELVVWGESDAPAPKRPGRARQKGAAHPFAAHAEELDAVLKEYGTRHAASVTLWLPSAANRPLPSSPLLAAPESSAGAVSLASWMAPAYRLAPDTTILFLGSCVDRQTLDSGVVVGEDLAYWTAALRFAGALLARQEFLPDLVEKDGAFFSRWRPVLLGRQASAKERLAAAMPASARAMTGLNASQPPERSRSALLSEFLALIVDFGARYSDVNVSKVRKARAFDAVDDAWVDALYTPDAKVQGERAALASFAERLQEWQRPLAALADSPYRLAFRLEEPPEDDPRKDQWHVKYLLQSQQDPSLLIPAKQAWKGSGKALALLQDKQFRPQELLLLSLGQAAGICPPVDASLKGADPEGFWLNATQAHDFLSTQGPALERSGFGVMLPSWWTRRGTKLRLAVRANVQSPKTQSKAGLTLDSLTEFNWQVALGGQTITKAELLALARQKSPLVQLRGQWVEVNADEIQAALELLKRNETQTTTLREIVQAALGRPLADAPPGFNGVTADGWIGKLLEQLEGRNAIETPPLPEGFHGQLRPYQERGYAWLSFLRQWGLGACLADDMGLGKTIQTLALLQHEREQADGATTPALLICPTSVVGNWQKEAQRFTPGLSVLVHHGAARSRDKKFAADAAKHDIVISSYALLQRDAELLRAVRWSAVVLDEAQNIKNPEAKQSRAARELKADFRVALTGTPVENHVGDLWPLMEFLNPGFLGKHADFRKRYFIPIQTQSDPAAAERLKKLTGPFVLRRLKTDKSIIADLPEKMEMKLYATLTKEQASLYQAVVDDATGALASAEGIKRKGVVLSTLMRLKQVCNHPAQFLGDGSPITAKSGEPRSGKLQRLTEMLAETMEAGDRVLIFSQFAEMGAILQKHLQETFGRETLFLHGAVSKKKRDTMVERFQEEKDGPPLFILSLKAGGTGLNLTRASHVFHFDRWWNPAVENQATDRAFRIGQKRNVQVHKFLCLGTLEEKIDEMIERKRNIAESTVSSGEGWLTELSTAELKNLFALRKEAVAS